MKTLVINNKPIRNYTDDFISENSELVKNWMFVNLYENNFINPLWNGNFWVESATAEEILEYEDNLIPTHINILDFRIGLIKIGIPIENIINTINAIPNTVIPDINKKIILVKLEFATTINRKDAEFIAIANLMKITQEQIKTIFINK